MSGESDNGKKSGLLAKWWSKLTSCFRTPVEDMEPGEAGPATPVPRSREDTPAATPRKTPAATPRKTPAATPRKTPVPTPREDTPVPTPYVAPGKVRSAVFRELLEDLRQGKGHSVG